jgi:hypothetical protein
LTGVVRSSCAGFLRATVLLASCLTGACSGAATGGVEVQVTAAPGAPVPATLRLDWLDGDTFRLHDVLVPTNGTLDPAAVPLAKVRIEIAGDAQGTRRVVVRGLVDTDIVSEGTAEIDVAPGSWTVLAVWLDPGRRPDRDGDGVPDAVDQCPDDRTTIGPCSGGPDAAMPTDVAAPVDVEMPADTSPEGDGPMPDAALDATVPSDLPADLSADASVPCGAVLLVVGVANNAGDKAMAMRLMQMGCTVTTVDDSTVSATDAAGKSLAIVSETVQASMVAGKLKLITIGLIDMQPQLLDDMSFTAHTQATDWDLGAMEQLVTVTAGHPLAAGLSGAVPILTEVASVAWGAPDSTAAIKVAAFPATPTRFFLFGYETGAAMSLNSKAAGRRVAFLASRDAVTKLNANGWALFDAAVRWAAGH